MKKINFGLSLLGFVIVLLFLFYMKINEKFLTINEHLETINSKLDHIDYDLHELEEK